MALKKGKSSDSSWKNWNHSAAHVQYENSYIECIIKLSRSRRDYRQEESWKHAHAPLFEWWKMSNKIISRARPRKK